MLFPSQNPPSHHLEKPLFRVFKTQEFAWLLIGFFWLVNWGGTFVGVSKLLNLFFPFSAFCVGLFLYFRFPILYVGFTWWLWIITPLFRRVVDFRSAFTDPSPILLAPLLVTVITGLTVARYLPKRIGNESISYVMSLSSIVFAFILGLINLDTVVVVIDFLEIVTPVFFGFHIYVYWQYYPLFRDNLKRVFLWAVLVMGIYGIYQFVVAPPWDTLWLKKADFNSGGIPVPYGIRVWSTLNSDGPFGNVMMAGLMLLIDSSSSKRVIAGISGLLSFLLSLNRSAWLAFTIGMMNIAGASKPKRQVQLMITLGLAGVAVIFLAPLGQFSDTIGERIGSLFNLSEDGSSQARQKQYASSLVPALSQIIGEGLGGKGRDSGIIYLLLQFGWIATLLYLGGLLLPLVNAYRSSYAKRDDFLVISRSIVLSLLLQMVGVVSIHHVSGMLMWSFTSFGLAGNKYYAHETNQEIAKSHHPLPDTT